MCPLPLTLLPSAPSTGHNPDNPLSLIAALVTGEIIQELRAIKDLACNSKSAPTLRQGSSKQIGAF